MALFAQEEQIQLANEYYQQGDYDKARDLFDQLAQSRSNISRINTNYIELLRKQNDDKALKQYFHRILKWYPSNLAYQVDELVYYHQAEDERQKQKIIDHLRERYGQNRYQMRQLAHELAAERMYKTAVDFFVRARELSNNPYAYALDLARVYRLLNQKENMVDEYLNYATKSRQSSAYIKNIFQNMIKENEDLSYLQNTLIRRMQKEPNETTYPDIMIWVELQRKNFYSAFLQSRALDKRKQNAGNETLRVGRIAMDNGSWDDAITIFEYLADAYGNTPRRTYYQKMLIEAKEGKVKNTYPIDKAAIRNLSKEYRELYERSPNTTATFEALKNLAHLHAFYLDEMDTAAIVLRRLIDEPRASSALVAEAKIDLGDIYLLKDKPWEATLLYSQVEKSHKESPMGYMAKLKNAKLHFYNGNFSLAKSHLDILKKATTREIANDAIDLSVLITDNTYLDSTDQVMQQYAAIDLMIFQNKYQKARQKLKQMLTRYPNHSIRDEVYWQLSQLAMKGGDFTQAEKYLQYIVEEFNYDILADDAAFNIAEIHDKYFNNEEKAKELYKQFLVDHPGSMYAAKARKRFRALRGDFVPKS